MIIIALAIILAGVVCAIAHEIENSLPQEACRLDSVPVGGSPGILWYMTVSPNEDTVIARLSTHPTR